MNKSRSPKESSLYGLLQLLRKHEIPYQIKTIKEGLENKAIVTTEILQDLLRKQLNISSTKKGVFVNQIDQLHLPVILQLSNGEHRLAEKADSDSISIRNPHNGNLEKFPVEEFTKQYSGVVLEIDRLENRSKKPSNLKQTSTETATFSSKTSAVFKKIVDYWHLASKELFSSLKRDHKASSDAKAEQPDPKPSTSPEQDTLPAEQSKVAEANNYSPEEDTGLKCLIMLLRILQVPFSVNNLRHRTGKSENLNSSDLVFLARDHLQLQAKIKQVKINNLSSLPFPVIAELKDGSFQLVIKFEGNTVYVQNPNINNVEKMSTDQFAEIFSQTVVMVTDKSVESSSAQYENFGLGWFIAAFSKHRVVFTQVIFSALIMQIFIMITPLFTMIIIDKVLSSSGTSTLEVLIIGLGIMTVFDYLVGYCRSQLLHHISNKVDLTLVSDLFRHMVSLPMTFFTGKQTGDTISRMREVESIRGFLTGSALTALIDFPFSLIFLVVMYFFSPLLCMVVVFSIVLSVSIYGFVGPMMKERVKKKQEATTDQQSFLFEIVTSIETIKSLSAEARIQKSWENQLVANSTNSSRSESVSNQVNLVATFLNKATIGVCLWLGALGVLSGDMTAGQLIAFNMLVGRVMGPAQRIAQIFQQLQQIKVSVERVREIFKTRSEPSLNSHLVSLPDLKGRFTLENVSFRYLPDSPPVIEKINLDIPSGQVVGVIGVSGSGKSTLMRLLQRLYVPSEGKILIDGINTAEINPEWLRRNIGVVLQDNVLLNRTIRENIAFTDPSISMEKIETAANLSGADEFIRKLPKVYDTIVGERGYLLSTGQRQRIALARALVNDPKVIILDEATSSLDYESEQTIQKNMKQICEGRTVFIVAHRFSTLRIANRIIALQDGKVIEDGSIIELLKKRGMFARLFMLQNIVKPDFLSKEETVSKASQGVPYEN